jgi:hypothetical protein
MKLILSTELGTTTQTIDKPGDVLIYVDSIMAEASRTKCLDKRIIIIYDPSDN